MNFVQNSAKNLVFLATVLVVVGAFSVPGSAKADDWGYDGSVMDVVDGGGGFPSGDLGGGSDGSLKDGGSSWNYDGSVFDQSGSGWNYDGSVFDQSGSGWNYDGSVFDQSNENGWNYDGSVYDENPNYSCDGSCGGSSYNEQCGCMTGGGSSGGFGGSSIGGSSGGSRGYSTGGGYIIYPPTPIQPPRYIPPQTPPQYPPSYNNTNITTNTCTNGSCNNTSTVTNINQTPQQPYYPVVYQQQPAPYCTITISNNGYSNGYNQYGTNGYYAPYNNQGTTLTWSSQNASNAYISGIGQVSTYGTRTVYTTGGQVYTMTVSGPGGTANCQTQAVYTPVPVPTPVPSNLYCQIYASPASIQNGQTTYLSWTSVGGTYAMLSDGIGNVAPNGSLAVRPERSRNYVLTVYGQYGGSTSCNTTVTVNGTTVSLTQIPYTGFDFGTVGNAIYWTAILAFAASLAYLAIYFNSGVLALAGNSLNGMQMPVRNVAPMKTIKVPAPTVAVRHMPVAAPVQKQEIQISLAAITEFKTNDKMTLIQSKEGEAPRLVISRS